MGTGRVATNALANRTHHPKSQLRRFIHLRRKLCIGYNGAPHTRPHNYPPIQWTDLQMPASSLDPSDLPSQTASMSDQPFCHNALDRVDARWRSAMHCKLVNQVWRRWGGRGVDDGTAALRPPSNSYRPRPTHSVSHHKATAGRANSRCSRSTTSSNVFLLKIDMHDVSIERVSTALSHTR